MGAQGSVKPPSNDILSSILSAGTRGIEKWYLVGLISQSWRSTRLPLPLPLRDAGNYGCDTQNRVGAMPKEIVRGEYTVEENGLPTRDEDLSYVHVGWDRDKYVQIATVEPRGAIAPWDRLQEKHVIAGGGTPGWFVTLDREGINALIRNLRKARDSAFGRDE